MARGTKIVYISGRHNQVGAASAISWDSQPDYDEWGWDSYWSCEDWMLWHQALKAHYGLTQANNIWIAAASNTSAGGHEQWCKYNTSVVNYLTSQGIDISDGVSALATGVQNIVQNTSTAATTLSNGVSKAASVTSYLLPVAVVGLAYYAYKKYLAT